MSTAETHSDTPRQEPLKPRYEFDYQRLKDLAAEFRTKGDGVRADLEGDRFVPFGERQHRSDFPEDFWKHLLAPANFESWKGIELWKSPLELALYHKLLWELKPRTVFEIGTYAGGGATWLADTLRAMEVPGHVIAVDIDLGLLDDRARKHPSITYVEGDTRQPERLFPADRLAGLEHPWLVIEDSHTHLERFLGYLHDHGLEAGDYVVVEDTNPYIRDHDETGAVLEDQGWEHQKDRPLTKFLAARDGCYLVDSYYCDFYGYNNTKNWNGFLKRVKR